MGPEYCPVCGQRLGTSLTSCPCGWVQASSATQPGETSPRVLLHGREYVRADLYAALEARVAELEAEKNKSRNKALEDAANVAERLRCNTCGVWFHPSEGHTDDNCAGGYTKWDSTGDASEIAAAIRAMKEPTNDD